MKNKTKKTISGNKFKIKLPRIKFLYTFVAAISIIVGTYLAIQIGKGYRPTKEGLAGTGLLAANSFPPGAEVYIDDKITTATDDTLNLTPGEYNVQIKKDGYIPWQKHLTIHQELVTQTNATLFRSVASLSPLTLSGATNITPSPDGQKIAYAVASASAITKNGLYVLELTSTPLSLQKAPKQIARGTSRLDFSQSQLLWSPSSNQVLAHLEPSPEETSNYLLSPDSFNDISDLRDVTARLPIILSEWEEDIALRESKQFLLLPLGLQEIATQSATNIYFSPNEEKIIYTGTEYVTLPAQLTKTPPATNTQPEERDIEPGGIYVYDLIEDKNFRVGTMSLEDDSPKKSLLLTQDYQQTSTTAANITDSSISEPITRFNHLQNPYFHQTLSNFRTHYSSLYVNGHQWYPNSTHILLKSPNQLDIIEYDATNQITLYSGPFEDNFVYPWPDGSKLIILTNLNPTTGTPPNLYAVDVK